MLLKHFGRTFAIALLLLSLAQCAKALGEFTSIGHLTTNLDLACPVVAPHASTVSGRPTQADGCRMLRNQIDEMASATTEASLWLALSGVLTFLFGIVLLFKSHRSSGIP